jgi:hypothetical protein
MVTQFRVTQFRVTQFGAKLFWVIATAARSYTEMPCFRVTHLRVTR